MLYKTPLQINNIYSINGQTGLLSYCDTSYSRDGVNQIWILKISKDQLVYIKARSISTSNSTKAFDISTLYSLKKFNLRKYKYLVLGRNK
jgi:hypothetical protein